MSWSAGGQPAFLINGHLNSVTDLPISLVVPIRNEEESIENLIESIIRQTRQPDEIVLVDGGSTDSTVQTAERLLAKNAKIKLIRTDGATPGKGRNIGIEAARNEWIALTDAGIVLETDWLENLAKAADRADIVYGNYSPLIRNLFEKCALISYAPPRQQDKIRGRSVASMLLLRSVSEKVGGFPDLRAAEDLMFMERAEAAGFRVATAPKAMVHWQLRPDVASTFRKFALYSKHNVWAGRQWDWHYGVAKQYLLLLPFIVLAIFHSWWWLLAIPLWLFARTAKRILAHKYEFGMATLFDPRVFFGVAGLILVIDAATFIGWGQALMSKRPAVSSERSE